MQSLTSNSARLCAFAVLLIALLTGAAFAVPSRHAPFQGGAVGNIVSSTPTAAGLQIRIAAAGQATQLGNFSRAEELVVDATGNFTGLILFIAENQDFLNATVTGAFISPTEAVGTYTLVGGTGRFVGATGTATFLAVSPDGLQMSARFGGTIFSP